MLIHHDPDEWENVSDSTICEYHKAHPGVAWPGCTCSANFGLRRRPPEEVARIKAERRRQEEDAILRQAEAIRDRRDAEAALGEPEGASWDEIKARHSLP